MADDHHHRDTSPRLTNSPPPTTELRTSDHPDQVQLSSETLAAVPSPPLHHHTDPIVGPADLQGSSTVHEGGKDQTQDQEPAGPPDNEIVVKDAVEEPQGQTKNQLQVYSTPLSEISPTSVSQSISSAPSPTVPEQRLSTPKDTGVHVLEVDKRTPSGGKKISSVPVARASVDGYNWRKYGQKQVKNPTGSRSYYRCTHSACCAKKIECCDHSGHVIEIVYKSQHSHDPPHTTYPARESKSLPSNEPNVEKIVPKQSIRVLNDFDPSPSPKNPLQEAPCDADKKRQNSSDSENGKVILKEEDVNEPELKRRMKKDDSTCLDSPVNPGKKQKFVVHAAGDVGISGDGHRWRKYGQKMVKGKPHPRNYYRCTSAGCPVRKHIETAADDPNDVIITYKGVHDHDMPVPKKRHGQPNAPLVAAAAPASMNNLQLIKTDSPQNQKISQCSEAPEGESTGKALDPGGEKAIESARTLLSIGFEIKPS